MKKNKKDKLMNALSRSKGIDRQIAKENKTLVLWRGRSAVHKSVKRNDRNIIKRQAIKDSSEN